MSIGRFPIKNGLSFFSLHIQVSEAATEAIFENICSFLSGEPFSGLFQEALLCVHRTGTNFPGRFIC